MGDVPYTLPTLSVHKHISHLGLDVWSCLFEHIPFKYVLFLLESGDSRVTSIIRRGLQHLQLNRTQTRYKPFPISFYNSFNDIKYLTISVTTDICYTSLYALDFLPKALRSLSISLTEKNKFAMITLLNKLLPSDKHSPSMLTELAIGNVKGSGVVPLDTASSGYLGNILRGLPHLTSLVCTVVVHPCIMSRIPKSILHLKLSLRCIEHVTDLEPFDFPNLLTMHFEAYGNVFNSRIVSFSFIFPKTLTDLHITTTDENIWSMLPPALSSLSVIGCKPTLKKDMLALPRSLTSLSVGSCLDSDLIPFLPSGLKTLRSNSGTAKFATCSASALPLSLTDLDMFGTIYSDEWKDLPRGLMKYRKTPLSISRTRSDDFPFLKDLPGSLTSLQFDCDVTPQVLLDIPNRRLLRHLKFNSSVDNEYLSLFTSDNSYHSGDEVLFPALETLDTFLIRDHYDYDLVLKGELQLPSLTELTLRMFSFKDLSSLVLPDTLRKLHLVSHYPNTRISFKLNNSLLCSLPNNLNHLVISGYSIDNSYLFFQSLPKNLVYLSLTVQKVTFTFEQLSLLPQSIQTLYLYLVYDDDDLSIFRTSLKSIMLSLPRYIESFFCNVISYPQVNSKLILDDCNDPSPEMNELLKIGIFMRYTPPFMTQFSSDLIDPKCSFKEAMEMLQKNSYLSII